MLKMSIKFFLERVRRPVLEDISYTMCGDLRTAILDSKPLRDHIKSREAMTRQTMVDMVERILVTKEEDERAREAEKRGRMAAYGPFN